VRNYLQIVISLIVVLTACEHNEPAISSSVSRKVKKVTYVDAINPQMNSETFYEYNSDGLITKEELYRDGVLKRRTLYNWSLSELIVTREYTDGQPSYTTTCKRITASDNVKFGSVGFVKTLIGTNGNEIKYYYRSSDNTLQSRCVIESSQPNVNQDVYHFNWSGQNMNRSYPFDGCMMGNNCSNTEPNWNFAQIEGVWTKLDYLSNRYETRDFGMKYIPYGLEDASGLTQFGTFNLLSKMTIYGSQDPNDVMSYNDYSYEFDNQGRIIKEIRTTDLGWTTYEEYLYFD
jgi:hypothetical protein